MKISAAIIMSLALLTSCAPKNSSQSPLDLIASKYFSMRQQTTTQYIGIIQLELPALLAMAQIKDGKAIINEDLKAAVIAEQEEVLAKLKALSPEVKIIATYKLVLNAIAFTAPSDIAKKIEALEGVNKFKVIENTAFMRPQTVDTDKKVTAIINGLNDKNSVIQIQQTNTSLTKKLLVEWIS